MKEFEVLQAIKNESSKNGKLAILKQGATEDLKKFLRYTMNRFITFRINQIDMPEVYNVVQPNLFQEFFILCDLLASHTLGTNDAKRAIKNFLAKSTPEGAAWFAKCIKRDLDIGMDEKSVNKVFPALIPVFDVQLAFPIDEHWESIQYPVMCDYKLDGMRVIAVCKDGAVTFYSREGRELENVQAFADQVVALRPGTDFVLDGELYGSTLNPNCKAAVKQVKAGKDFRFAQALAMCKTSDTTKQEMKDYLHYIVWDIIELPYFESQGKQGNAESCKERRLKLAALFERRNKELNNIKYLDSIIAESKEDIIRIRDEAIAEGYEGCMIKSLSANYDFKRSKAVLKFKEFHTCDLFITDAIEGEGKLRGMLGAIIVEGEGIKSKVGSGFTEEDRTELWIDYLSGNLKGKLVEVSYQEQTSDGSLRFPTFLRIRDDKSSTSLN